VSLPASLKAPASLNSVGLNDAKTQPASTCNSDINMKWKVRSSDETELGWRHGTSSWPNGKGPPRCMLLANVFLWVAVFDKIRNQTAPIPLSNYWTGESIWWYGFIPAAGVGDVGAVTIYGCKTVQGSRQLIKSIYKSWFQKVTLAVFSMTNVFLWHSCTGLLQQHRTFFSNDSMTP